MTNDGGMIDISGKGVTERIARASACIKLGDEAFIAVKEGSCAKGDVLGTAKISAIGAVKSTPSMIPMCHPVGIEAVQVEFDLNEKDKSVCVCVTVKSFGKTGVEMEALCGASVAALTIYDMLKYMGKEMTVTSVKLIQKTGGKSGDYHRKD